VVEIIAEFGKSNRGDLATAIKQADTAKAAGCSWVKFPQTAVLPAVWGASTAACAALPIFPR